MRASSLIGRLGLRRVPVNRMPLETTGATFAWVGENKPKLLSAGAASTLSLPWAKAAGIIAVSDEFLQFAQPGNETSLRDVLVKGVQLFVDVNCAIRRLRLRRRGLGGWRGERLADGGGLGCDVRGRRDRLAE